MQQTKLKTNGTEYIIKANALRSGMRCYGYGWNCGPTPSVTVVEKGLKTDPWLERANAVRVRVSDETWNKITETCGVDRMAACDREFVVSSRKLIEGKEARVERLRAEEERQRAEREERDNQLREKAGGITTAMIGRLIEQSETSTGRACRTYRDAVQRLAAACQDEITRLDESVHNDYDATLKDGVDQYPTPQPRLTRHLENAESAYEKYGKSVRDFDNWVTMKNAAEEEQVAA